MKLTLMLATVGRNTLARTLQSLERQAWQPGDEVMVVTDTNHSQVSKMLSEQGFNKSLPLRHLAIKDGPHKDWGHTPRNRTMHLAAGDFLCHFDDDDVALPSMVKDIHAVLAEPAVHLFRLIAHNKKRKVWTVPGLIQRSHISTQNVVHPNIPKTFGRWGRFYGGDHQFIAQTAAFYPGRVKFHDVVTCVYNPPPDLTLDDVLNWYESTLPAAAPPSPAEGQPGQDTSAGTS